ncbi:mitochondrial intermembrane space import and assembly protein 40 [Magnaporthiopsis poae ATCC 64411]|uniref:Mitochondrial intermembrane space import and assembly protein 40 n=1 Tax=Magnaporthiopsis poae (strain ATCC 64411 / 73-15) TaxID=644358 RepID=A0A0C4DNE9_MAGP6|nr:mitochondrial intermembrane space import and assembly protein 40 [Magnaporthiopsis poae ATCC 64411]
MFRATLRSTARATRSATSTATLTSTSRRYLSLGPSDKPRTWKGAAVRWGLAFGAFYWYNTSPIFADEPLPQTILAPPHFSDDDLPTVESVIAQKRKEAEARAKRAAASAPSSPPPSEKEKKDETKSVKEDSATPAAAAAPGSPEALEEEAGQQGAFNPETGEINWDCPCLGGMADGPCGEQFKAAFSCFVYSTEEPKGMDCIDKFQHMQDCFKKYPEIYGSELADEDGEEPTDAPASNEEAPAAAPRDVKELQEMPGTPAAPRQEKKDIQEMPEAPAAAKKEKKEVQENQENQETPAVPVSSDAAAPEEEKKKVEEKPKTPSAPATTPVAEKKKLAAPASTPRAASDATDANQK